MERIKILGYKDLYCKYYIGDNHSFPEFVNREELENDTKIFSIKMNEYYKKHIWFDPKNFKCSGVVYCKNKCGIYMYSCNEYSFNDEFNCNTLLFPMIGFRCERSEGLNYNDSNKFISNSTCEEILIINFIS